MFSCIPSAVLGGVALSAFGTILVSGMNVIHNGGPLTARTTTIVAISLAVVVLSLILPEKKEEKAA